MALKTNKTIEYRRARFLEEGQNLEQLVRQAWSQFTTQADRTITYRDGRSASGLKSRNGHRLGLAIHCGSFRDKQPVGTIPTTPALEVDIGERSPEPSENFLNSDFMALLYENHLVCLNSGRNAGTLRIFLQQLFEKAGFPQSTQQFDLARIGNPNMIAKIKTVGVKSVDLKVNIADATASELLEESTSTGSFAKILSAPLSAIARKDESICNIRNSNHGTVAVSINIPNKDLETAKHGLDAFAEEVAGDESADGYVINLRDGATIKPDEISVIKKVAIETTANSVSVLQSWDAMESFMHELIQSGQLEA